MDLNSNPGLSLPITVMNTNAFTLGLGRFISDIIRPSLVSVVAAGAGWKDSSDCVTCLELKTRSCLQMSCILLSALIDNPSPPYAVHLLRQQELAVRFTVYSFYLVQL